MMTSMTNKIRITISKLQSLKTQKSEEIWSHWHIFSPGEITNGAIGTSHLRIAQIELKINALRMCELPICAIIKSFFC
jgi:hypothetical protein